MNGLRMTVFALVAIFSACSESGIGRPCSTGATGAGGTGMIQDVINSQALECPSRICVQKAPEVGASSNVIPGALCSAFCENDDDCSSDLIDKNAGVGGKCKSKFKCAVASDTGKFKCRKMCICGDVLKPGTPGLPPECAAQGLTAPEQSIDPALEAR